MTEFTHDVLVGPAFDKRSDDASKNYGIGSCRITFVLKGPKGAIQFMIGTDWYLPHVHTELTAKGGIHIGVRNDCAVYGWDVGYHSPVPMYDGQTPMKNQCEILGGTCYYDGSSLYADELVPQFIAGGTAWLWPKLEEIYRERFEAPDAGA